MLALGLVLGGATTASANTPEDVLGLGSRVIGLGGAGTATSDDFSSLYYNPANLTFCPNRSFSLYLSHTAHDLSFEAEPGDPDLETVRDMTRAYLGFCTDLPYGLGFGITFGTGFQKPMSLDQTTLSETPQLVAYGEPLEQLTIMLGVGWRIWDELAIGVGAAVLVNSFLIVDAAIPVAGSDDEVYAALHWDLKPTAAAYLGARWSPIPELDLGVAYRGALFHDLEGNALVDVTVVDVLLEVDLLLESAGWYSPQQVALGGAVRPLEQLTIAADVTWYDWSAHPGPFIVASPAGEDPMSVAAALRYAPREDLGFRDVWVPRVGVEYRFPNPGVALRAGYAHRPAIVAEPRGRANLLDAATNTAVLGAGIHLGGHRQGDPNSAFGSMAGEPRAPISEAIHSGLNAQLDAHFRLTAMDARHVIRTGDARQPVLNDYTFGGTVFDLGLTATIGWY